MADESPGSVHLVSLQTAAPDNLWILGVDDLVPLADIRSADMSDQSPASKTTVVPSSHDKITSGIEGGEDHFDLLGV